MSIQALNWALAQNQIDNSGAKFILLLLCNYANEDGQCYPSRSTLAKKAAMSVRSVQNHINWLADRGYITWTNEHTSANKQTPNVYQLPSADSAHLPQKPSAESAKAECKIRQKPSAESAHYTSEEIHQKNTVIEVFDFWKTTMSLTGNTLLSAKRKSRVRDRLKDGYSIERIKNAILGCSISPFHCGQNENREVYNDLELICRSGEKLEKHELRWLNRQVKPTLSDEEKLMREGVRMSRELGKYVANP